MLSLSDLWHPVTPADSQESCTSFNMQPLSADPGTSPNTTQRFADDDHAELWHPLTAASSLTGQQTIESGADRGSVFAPPQAQPEQSTEQQLTSTANSIFITAAAAACGQDDELWHPLTPVFPLGAPLSTFVAPAATSVPHPNHNNDGVLIPLLSHDGSELMSPVEARGLMVSSGRRGGRYCDYSASLEALSVEYERR